MAGVAVKGLLRFAKLGLRWAFYIACLSTTAAATGFSLHMVGSHWAEADTYARIIGSLGCASLVVATWALMTEKP